MQLQIACTGRSSLRTFTFSDNAASLLGKSLWFSLSVKSEDLQSFVFIQTTLHFHLMLSTYKVRAHIFYIQNIPD